MDRAGKREVKTANAERPLHPREVHQGDTLYRTFKGETRPAFDTVMNVLIALDIQIVAKPIRRLVELGLKAKGK